MFFKPKPNIETWEAGRPIVRVHSSTFGATEFNPGAGQGRFHPLAHAGDPIPTLYGSGTIDGALSETIFHNIPVAGPSKHIRMSALLPMVVSTIAPLRPLRLIQLRGPGLRKLELERRQLIDSEADQYPVTRAWCARLYAAAPDCDGLLWMSRQDDRSEAVMLFGTRVRREELQVIAPPLPLHPPGAGWIEVLRAAEAAGICVTLC